MYLQIWYLFYFQESYHEIQQGKKNTNGLAYKMANINPTVLVEETETETETTPLRQSSV